MGPFRHHEMNRTAHPTHWKRGGSSTFRFQWMKIRTKMDQCFSNRHLKRDSPWDYQETMFSYQNSPSLRTRTLRSSLSRSESESHSQDRSDQGPFHSPRPQGLRRRTNGTSPLLLLTRASPVTLYAVCEVKPLRRRKGRLLSLSCQRWTIQSESCLTQQCYILDGNQISSKMKMSYITIEYTLHFQSKF